MARTEIAKQASARSGSNVVFGAVTAAAAPDGHYIDTDGSVAVLIKNTGAGPNTMTVDVPQIVDGVAVADRVVTVPAGQTWRWQPTDVHRQSNGQVHLNFSHATELTVAVLDV
jgi:archaellum component FlaG (FlaF/FlaG flagellin family)